MIKQLMKHYQTLEVDWGASLEEIKQAYKDLVTVWHPDRFLQNPRLQKKAQEKLKDFNEAYEHLKTRCSGEKVDPQSEPTVRSRASTTASKAHTQRTSAQAHQTHTHTHAGDSPRTESRTESHAHQVPHHPSPPASGGGAYSAMISLPIAKAVLNQYRFTLVRLDPGSYQHYVSGPFDLQVWPEGPEGPEVLLAVPCDSINTFHRALLSFPCKSSGFFRGAEATDLLNQLKTSQ